MTTTMPKVLVPILLVVGLALASGLATYAVLTHSTGTHTVSTTPGRNDTGTKNNTTTGPGSGTVFPLSFAPPMTATSGGYAQYRYNLTVDSTPETWMNFSIIISGAPGTSNDVSSCAVEIQSSSGSKIAEYGFSPGNTGWVSGASAGIALGQSLTLSCSSSLDLSGSSLVISGARGVMGSVTLAIP
jgi:hypothetical protein